MAKVTIGALKYDVIADTERFTRTMTATRKEMRDAGRIAKQSLGPQEKFADELARLNNLRRKGLISATAYTKAVDREARAARNAARAETMHGRALNYVNSQYGQLLTITGALIGMRAVGGNLLGELERVDNLNKTARALGVAANELNGLRLAASRMAGVASGQLDQALKKLNVRVSEAAQNTGEARHVFKELGLNARELERLGPAKAMREIARAFRGVETQADKARIANKLFEESGVQLINMLDGGAEAFDQYAKMALTVTPEIAAATEELNDNLDQLGIEWQRLANVYNHFVIPILVTVTDELIEMAEVLRLISQRWSDLTGRGTVANLMNFINPAAGFMANTLDLLNAPAKETNRHLEEQTEATREQTATIKQTSASLQQGTRTEYQVLRQIAAKDEQLNKQRWAAAFAQREQIIQALSGAGFSGV